MNTMASGSHLKALLGQRPVLILHNAPDRHAADSGRKTSDASVMDQVAAVAGALHHIGIPWRQAAVRRLDDIPVAMAAGPEPVVFNLVESLVPHSEAMVWVPAVCQAMGRACTGGDSHALLITQDKALAKRILIDAGVPVPLSVSVPNGQTVPAGGLPDFPVIVKPVATDASEGIDAQSVIVRPGLTLNTAVTRLHRLFQQAALIETFIDGREFNVALVQSETGVRVLPPAEILFKDFPLGMPHIVDYDAKWNDQSFAFHHTPRQVPAHLEETETVLLRETALHAWNATGCRDFARVDMRMDAQGRVNVLEINVNPDLSPDAGFAAALKADGMAFHNFVSLMLVNALLRSEAIPTEPPDIATSQDSSAINIRYVEKSDRDRIGNILRDTRFFRPDELAIAEEVLDDALAKGPSGHYQSFAACRAHGAIAGWVCIGPTPCTQGTWDIYWLAVDPHHQGQGIGRVLMQFAEARIRQAGGRLCIAETSGRETYAPTRRFYERIGYRVAGCIQDFYAPGDDKLVLSRLTNGAD